MFAKYHIEENRNYAELLKKTMDHVNIGRLNAAYFEHFYFAEKTGAHLVTCDNLRIKNENLYFVGYSGKLEKVGAVYRRISDEYIDPVNFNKNSVIGVPHIFEIYKKGNVALINAPGNGAADDKGIYYFVPAMIKYYLGEEPILQNVPAYLPIYENDLKYVLVNFDKLVIKDVSEAGGYGVVFGDKLAHDKKKILLQY